MLTFYEALLNVCARVARGSLHVLTVVIKVYGSFDNAFLRHNEIFINSFSHRYSMFISVVGMFHDSSTSVGVMFSQRFIAVLLARS